jgi:hypothetical protein
MKKLNLKSKNFPRTARLARSVMGGGKMALLTTVLTLNAYQLWGQSCLPGSTSVVLIQSQSDWNTLLINQADLQGVFALDGNFTVDLDQLPSNQYDFRINAKIQISQGSNITFITTQGVIFNSACSITPWEGIEINGQSKTKFKGDITIKNAKTAIKNFSPANNAFLSKLECIGTKFVNNENGINIADPLFNRLYLSSALFTVDNFHFKLSGLKFPSTYDVGTFVNFTGKYLRVVFSIFDNQVDVLSDFDRASGLRGAGIRADGCASVYIMNRTIGDHHYDENLLGDPIDPGFCVKNSLRANEENEFKNLAYGIILDNCGTVGIYKNKFIDVYKSIRVNENDITKKIKIIENDISTDFTVLVSTLDMKWGTVGIEVEFSKNYLIMQNSIINAFPPGGTQHQVYAHGLRIVRTIRDAQNAEFVHSQIKKNHVIFTGEVSKTFASQFTSTDWVDERTSSCINIVDENKSVDLTCNIFDVNACQYTYWQNPSTTGQGLYCASVNPQVGNSIMLGDPILKKLGSLSQSAGNLFLFDVGGINSSYNWSTPQIYFVNPKVVVEHFGVSSGTEYNSRPISPLILGPNPQTGIFHTVANTANSCPTDNCWDENDPSGWTPIQGMKQYDPEELMPPTSYAFYSRTIEDKTLMGALQTAMNAQLLEGSLKLFDLQCHQILNTQNLNRGEYVYKAIMLNNTNLTGIVIIK